MTDKQLAEIETRLNAATPGPWQTKYETMVFDGPGHRPVAGCGMSQHDEGMAAVNCANAALIAEVRRLTEFAAKFSLAWEKLCDFEMDNPPPPKEAGIDEYRCWRKELNAHKNVIHDLIEPPKTRVALNIDALQTDS